jgi:hypothetical protein
MAAALLGGVTNVVLLENMLDAATIRQADERQEVRGRRLGVRCYRHKRHSQCHASHQLLVLQDATWCGGSVSPRP